MYVQNNSGDVESISRLEETAILKIIAGDFGHAPRNSMKQSVADMAYKFGNKDMHKGKSVGKTRALSGDDFVWDMIPRHWLIGYRRLDAM